MFVHAWKEDQTGTFGWSFSLLSRPCLSCSSNFWRRCRTERGVSFAAWHKHRPRCGEAPRRQGALRPRRLLDEGQEPDRARGAPRGRRGVGRKCLTSLLRCRWVCALFVLDHIDVSEHSAARNRPAFRKLSYHATAEIFVCLYRISLIAKSICEEGKSNLRWAGPVASESLFPMLE
jgi:hypothetical protein